MKDWISPSQASAARQPDAVSDLECVLEPILEPILSEPLAASPAGALTPTFEAPDPLLFPTASTTARAIDQAQRTALLDEEISGLLATHGRTFHFAARFMPPEQRRAVIILYGFFRTLDDLVDEPQSSRGQRAIQDELAMWRAWFAGRGQLSTERANLGACLAEVIEQYSIPTPLFVDFLDGLVDDTQPRAVRDFTEMRRYCYQVAGVVGLVMARVLGGVSPQALEAAESLGIAMQLTNILRDVGGDLTRDRVYLPEDELRSFGLARRDLELLATKRRGPDERFRALMKYQIARAHCYYSHGMAGVWYLPRESRFPILVAGRLYRRILTVIERNDYDVLRARASTNLREKLQEAGMALLLERLWRHGEQPHGDDATMAALAVWEAGDAAEG